MISCKGLTHKTNRILYSVILTAYFVGLVFLFYNQLTTYAISGRYESDTLVHVRFAVEDGYFYSLSSFVYAFFNLFPGISVSVSVLLAGLTVGSVLLTRKLLYVLFDIYETAVSETGLNLLSIVLNVAIAFYVSFVNRAHYIGYQSGNMWHNSTYIFMRFFALITLLYYVKIREKYKKEFTFTNWVVFSFLLMITTGFKASFLTVFAPFLLVKLLYDWAHKAPFKNVFFFGTTVFPAIFVMYLESLVLFPGTGESGYKISPFEALSLRGDHPKISLILSIAFPLCVLLFNGAKLLKDKIYLGSFIIWVIGFLEVFLFVETGERALDGNFFWGYSIALFIWFAVSAVRMVVSCKQSLSKINTGIFVCQVLILAWHFISGIWYFVLLLQGNTYFI